MHFFLSIFISLFFLCEKVSGDIPPCVQALELQFFQQNLVQEALSLHGISQSNWTLIYYELSKRVKKVPEIVARRASQMQPNPYGPPYKPFLLQEIVESTLLAVFKETLSVFHIQNESRATEMFGYIRNKQNQRFIQCFGDPNILKTKP